MPSLVTDPAETIIAHPTQTVEVIDHLSAAGGWAVVPYLFCTQLMKAVNAYDQASLRYEIGADVMQPGDTTFDDYIPLSITDKYCRVTVTPDGEDPFVWYGYILEDQIDRDGVKVVGGINKLVGAGQVFTAVGLEYFLDRKQIDSAVVHDTTRILRPLTFNGGASTAIDPDGSARANRHPTINADSIYSFASDPNNASLWAMDEIIWHLLKYHTPVDTGDDPSPTEYTLALASGQE